MRDFEDLDDLRLDLENGLSYLKHDVEDISRRLDTERENVEKRFDTEILERFDDLETQLLEAVNKVQENLDVIEGKFFKKIEKNQRKLEEKSESVESTLHEYREDIKFLKDRVEGIFRGGKKMGSILTTRYQYHSFKLSSSIWVQSLVLFLFSESILSLFSVPYTFWIASGVGVFSAIIALIRHSNTAKILNESVGESVL